MKVYESEVTLKSPHGLTSGTWALSDLTPMTVLFGKNGSGKSILLRQWRDHDIENSHYVVPERTGTLDFNPSMVQRQGTPKQRRDLSKSNLASEYRQDIVGRIHTYFLTRGDIRDGKWRGDPNQVEYLIGQILPDFDVSISKNTPPFKITRSSSGDSVSRADQLSSGEAQILLMGLDILTICEIWTIEEQEKRILFVDEPDAHIHPDLQARFADFLVTVGREYLLQVVVATHSTTLVSALGQFGNDDVGVLYLDRIKDKHTPVKFSKVLRELSSCLGGHVLMGALFSVPILLVEGDDDYRIWSQVPRHHQINIAVIPCGGDKIKDYQRALESVLSALREGDTPAGFALLDGDKNVPTDNHTPQNQIKFIALNCQEAENLYLTDEVLEDLGLTWETALDRIVEKSQSDDFGEKADFLSDAANWDRRCVDLKPNNTNHIEEIARSLDDKNVHWTRRVGAAIGKAYPTGQLAEFLGADVIESLWGEAPAAGRS